jgi:hypothetical protein
MAHRRGDDLKQQTLGGFAKYAKPTRRAQCLAEMDRVVPWAQLVAAISRRCKCRHLLERRGLGQTLLTAINRYLHENGIKVATGTLVDAAIIGAPSSTKNGDGERDPRMHQTKTGNPWYFGMQAHVAVDKPDPAEPDGPGRGRQGGRQRRAALPAAWPGDPGVGGSGVPGPGCGDPPGRQVMVRRQLLHGT